MTKKVRPLILYDAKHAVLIEGSNWCLTCGYPSRRRNGKLEYLHHLLKKARPGLEIDHKNGNKLDVRRKNLRWVTHYANCQNLRLSSKNKSGYRGVSWCSRDKLWKANARFKGKQRFLGRFKSALEAAKVASAFRSKHMKGSIE